MRFIKDLSFVSRIGCCMLISLAINLYTAHGLKQSLSQESYSFEIDATYEAEGSMQFLYDTGNSFNSDQRVDAAVKKGQNKLEFPFHLKEGQHLKYIRLDFGSNRNMKKVVINSISLSDGKKSLFSLEKQDIVKKLGLLVSISEADKATSTFTINTEQIPFDPYIVFDPVNELVYSKWQRTLLLVVPWLVIFFLPLVRALKELKAEQTYGLFFTGLFIVAIPLKIAWVTFTTLLLLGYALFRFYKTRRFRIGPIQILLLLFFMIPVLFLGEGETSKLAIPLGFVLFVLISAMVDFSDKTNRIKKIYTKVFFIVIAISIVSWVLLMVYNGYYYNIDLHSYFTDVKSDVHTTLFWLYYPHPTFLSFFILIGGLFCLDLYKSRQITKAYGAVYALLALFTLLLLGSRFSLLLGLTLPLLYALPIKPLIRGLIPLWAVVFTGVFIFIGVLDSQREKLWRISWEAISDKVWLGHGTGTSSKVLPDHIMVNKSGVETLMAVNHSHNQFLTYLLENGLLGVLLFLAAFLFLFYQFAKKKNKTMLLVLFMILLLMIIESPFRTTTSLYVIAFLISVFYIPGKKESKR